MKENKVITILDKKLFGPACYTLKNNGIILSTSLVVVFLRKVKDYIAPIIVVYENVCSGVGGLPLCFD